MKVWWVAAGLLLALGGCGGGGGEEGPVASPASSSAAGQVIPGPGIAGANVLRVTLDRGTDGSALNAPFVTVTVCQPGTSTCVDVDHVLVDTGSSGLRLAASALPPAVALPLLTTGGAPVGQCAHFSSGFSWGAVRQADVRLGGEVAPGISIQVVDDPAAPFAAVPADCTATGRNIGAGRGARGILGVGLFDRDCGTACEVSTAPAVYFACGDSGCTSARVPVAVQVRNPVAALPTDSNGVVLSLPAVPAGGAAGATGSLVLGVGTQANNQLGNATVYATDSQGFFTTTYKGQAFPQSFLDSGSNGLFFSDPSLQQCGDFYCPGGTVALSATNTSATGVSGKVDFTIDSIDKLSGTVAVANVGGDPGLPRTFDWGLPFFLGRTVFVARAGAATPAGPGPYWAY
jgi:hypothetical protein